MNGPELPHDLWSTVQLPNLTLDQKVALLLVGFDRWFERSQDGVQIRIIDFPHLETGTVEFGNFDDARELVVNLRRQFPDCRISISGKKLAGTGTPGELADIKAALVSHSSARPPNGDDKRRFTLTTRNSRGSILTTVAQQTGNRLDFSPALRRVLEEPIEVSVKEVTLEELIEKVLEGTTATYQIANGMLTILEK